MKHTLKLALILLLVYIWLPLTPSDIIITPFLIGLFGKELFIIISVVLVVWLYYTIPGRTIGDKLSSIQHEIGELFR